MSWVDCYVTLRWKTILALQANDEGNTAAMQAAERANQPRRAAARAYQSFKNQEDYFSDSPPDSPIDDERQVNLLFGSPCYRFNKGLFALWSLPNLRVCISTSEIPQRVHWGVCICQFKWVINLRHDLSPILEWLNFDGVAWPILLCQRHKDQEALI